MLLALTLGCFDYGFFIPSDEDPLNWLDWPGAANVEHWDPYSLCDTWEADLYDQVSTDETCLQEPVFGDLEARVEWRLDRFRDEHQYGYTVMAPVVGQLTDDNGDGVIDRSDVPDIFMVSDQEEGQTNEFIGAARLISGDGLVEHWASSVILSGENQVYPYRYSNAALGDIDRDGTAEIVLVATIHGEPTDPGGDGGGTDTAPVESGGPDDTDGGGGPGDPIDGGMPPQVQCYPVALDNGGSVKWIGWEAPISCGGHAPALADLEGDGDVEVILGNYILDGDDGGLQASGIGGEARGSALSEMGSIVAIADLDMDGVQEIVAGNTVYAPTGEVICKTGGGDGYPAIADLDLDGQGEFLLVSDGKMQVYEADCSRVGQWNIASGAHGGPPTIADFDTDGVPEVGVAEASTYSVYEVDGTRLWSAPVSDASSHSTGSVVFDFEGDGRPEAVYADETTLWVFDGETGAVRMQDGRHESRTLHEFPTVVDVDGDGSTEIIVPNGGTHGGANSTGIYVLGSASKPWLGNRQVWNQHAYCITNVDDDLGIPSPAESNWPDHNNFRSGDPNPPPDGTAADAVPMVGVCDLECPVGQVAVHVRIANQGMGEMRGRVPVSVYAVNADGDEFLVSGLTDDQRVPAGGASNTVILRFEEGLVPSGEIRVVVDDDNGAPVVRECHEDNNEALLDIRCD